MPAPARRAPRKPGRRPAPRRAARPPAPPPRGGPPWFALTLLTVLAAAFPVAADRIVNDQTVTGAFFAPLALWLAAALLAAWWSRPRLFAGDRGLVALTLLLLGLGVVEQLRLGTWEESWIAWRAYAPLLAGLAGFLLALRALPARLLLAALPRLRWLCWLAALAVLTLLAAFGHRYRGGTFLPGRVNPSELAKLALVLFAAAWLPAHAEGLARTRLGIPVPPWRDALPLACLWGLPVLGAAAVGDLGLALILCLTLVLMLAALTRRPGWLLLGLGAAAAAAALVAPLFAHAAARLAVWRDPFADPLGAGWQIGQSLCAQYAGGLWGAGLGQGTPRAVPIVSSDFVYAAVAEEWGLVGCALLLALYLLLILRVARAGASHATPAARLLGIGLAALLGAQTLLNVAGVTKALPMTGITLPLLSQGGFSLMTTLLALGLAVALSKPPQT